MKIENTVSQLESRVNELSKLLNHVHDALDLSTLTSEPIYPIVKTSLHVCHKCGKPVNPKDEWIISGPYPNPNEYYHQNCLKDSMMIHVNYDKHKTTVYQGRGKQCFTMQ